MNEATRKRLLARIDSQIDATIMGAISGTSAVNAAPQEPLTIDTLRRMMIGLPPAETWLCSEMFPPGSALRVEGAGENFLCANRAFWSRLHDGLRKAAEPAKPWSNPLGMNVTPIDIDPQPDDDDQGLEWRCGHWRRLIEAMQVAMTPLPDWLRSAPKFGKHE